MAQSVMQSICMTNFGEVELDSWTPLPGVYVTYGGEAGGYPAASILWVRGEASPEGASIVSFGGTTSSICQRMSFST